jgi:hypothetical protein
MKQSNTDSSTFRFLSPKSIGINKNPPDAGGVAHALSRIGYKLEEALSDLIDNSIDAYAKSILIRFFRDDKKIHSVVIIDNGTGISEAKLSEAMKFGVRLDHKDQDLGKYGMGLKTASFSQGRSFSVITKFRGNICGQRWTIENIEKGWNCEKLNETESSEFLNQNWKNIKIEKSGTIILWEILDHLETMNDGVDATLNKILKKVPIHLGLTFHRFISSNRLRIIIDSFNTQQNILGPSLEVESLDPFGYTQSGKQSYPRSFSIKLPDLQKLMLEAHIWPPLSKQKEYKLGGGNVALRQGFYFYRNDRLIQAGGWNTWRENQSEPHLSLARVKINLPPAFDSVFRLKVQKSGIDVPPEFKKSIDELDKNPPGLSRFIKDADEVYRKSKIKKNTSRIFLPGKGFPTKYKKVLKNIAAPENQKTLSVNFRWARMTKNKFFEVNFIDKEISLNKFYKKNIITPGETNHNEIMIKILFFLLLKDQLSKKKLTASNKILIDNLNDIFVNLYSEDLSDQ